MNKFQIRAKQKDTKHSPNNRVNIYSCGRGGDGEGRTDNKPKWKIEEGQGNSPNLTLTIVFQAIP